MSTYEYLKEQGYEVITIHRQRDIDNGLHYSLQNDISEQGFNITYDLEVRGDILNSNAIQEIIRFKLVGHES